MQIVNVETDLWVKWFVIFHENITFWAYFKSGERETETERDREVWINCIGFKI